MTSPLKKDFVEIELKSQSGELGHYSVDSKSDLSVLESIEDKGGRSPFGCRVGTCGTCVVRVTEGAELLQAPLQMELDTLERIPGESPEGLRLACRAQLSPGVSGKLCIEKIRIR